MYNEYFGLTDRPFSIAPDPRYLYMSNQHREALAHLTYGVQQEGGFILLTGEVGTGKTTVCRCFLKQLDDRIDVAYIVNPKQTSTELLESMCDDLNIAHFQDDISIKSLTDAITSRLLENHAKGKSTVLLIDEAQNLSVEVLEQLRLLTNLETDQKKLLQIILLGQPELLDLLAKPELRQLSQRVTARFHMDKLDRKDIIPYVQHRLAVAGCRMSLFPQRAAKIIEKASGGVPRLINLICDRALLGVYSSNGSVVTPQTLKRAAKEVLGEQRKSGQLTTQSHWLWTAGALALAIQGVLVLTWLYGHDEQLTAEPLADIAIPEITAPVEVLAGSNMQESVEVKTDQEVANPFTGVFNDQAYAMLGTSWGLGVLPNNWYQICADLSQTRLKCESTNLSWIKLVTVNRPFVATVIYQGKAERILVEALDVDGINYRLRLKGSDKETLWLDQALFNHIWTGRVEYLWLQPEVNMPILRPGDIHNYVQYIRAFLTRVEGDPVYDLALSESVRQFQTEKGITSDGVIGPETMMLVNSITGEVPMLLDTSSKSEPVAENSDSSSIDTLTEGAVETPVLQNESLNQKSAEEPPKNETMMSELEIKGVRG